MREELLLAAARTPEAQEPEVRVPAPNERLEELPESGVERSRGWRGPWSFRKRASQLWKSSSRFSSTISWSGF
jgi:hypothetical protein